MSDFFTLDNGEALFLDEYSDVSPNSIDRPVTLIALHGLGGGGYFFAGIAGSLALYGPVFCPDMPGSGFSRRGERPISFDLFADAVVQLIERKTSGAVALMGHSMLRFWQPPDAEPERNVSKPSRIRGFKSAGKRSLVDIALGSAVDRGLAPLPVLSATVIGLY